MSKFLSVLLFFVMCPLAWASWTAPDRWEPIARESALQLAARDGASWKAAVQNAHILLGLGPNGRERLQARAKNQDEKSREFWTLILAAADAAEKTPLPAYAGPSKDTVFVADSEEWMRDYGDELILLTVAANVRGAPADRQRLHDLVLTLCRFPSWGRTYLDADLAAGHVGRGIAMAWNWHRDAWTPNEQREIIGVVRDRMNRMTRAIYGGKIWWAGAYAANHNQVSVTGAAYCGIAFLDDIPEATEWLAASWLDFEKVIEHGSNDGSSPEGLAYWTYGMSFILQFIEGVRGVLPSETFYQSPYLRQAGRYRMESSTPGFHGIVPWGDSGPRDFCGPHHILFRLAAQYRDSEVQALATRLPFPPRGRPDSLTWSWLWYDGSLPSEPLPTKPDRHFENIDVLVSRSGWGPRDYLLTMKSGFTNRDHSHLDAGAIALVYGNDWLIPSPGYGEGRVNSDFWDKHGSRWQYLSNSTEANTTLLINGRNQLNDYDTRARIDRYVSEPETMWVECDLSQVYADVMSVRRELFHRRGEFILVHDRVVLPQAGNVSWLLQVPSPTKATATTADVVGRVGQLHARALGTTAQWAPREPTSAHQDLPAATRATTFAWTQPGRDVHFDVLLVPGPAGRPLREIASQVQPDGTIELTRGERKERIHFDDATQEFSLEGVAGTARFRDVVWQKGVLSEVVLRDAQHLKITPLEIRSADTVALTLRRKSAGEWTLLIGAANEVSFVLAPNVTLEREIAGKYERVEHLEHVLSAAGTYRLLEVPPSAP